MDTRSFSGWFSTFDVVLEQSRSTSTTPSPTLFLLPPWCPCLKCYLVIRIPYHLKSQRSDKWHMDAQTTQTWMYCLGGGVGKRRTTLICWDGNRTALSVCVSRLESPGVQLHIFVGAKDAWQTLGKGDKGWSWRRGVTADKPRMGLRERSKKWAGRGWRGCKVIHNTQGWVTALSVSL